uniref:NADH dehydrogenase subunit 6 n=1 Tax=Allodia pyxidiiformis TaxID=1749355 RepID=UPI001EDD693F|nr:NADH dehydrogenase subunit 6 [Allodia pyxidiiformis]UIP57093.1 NADH dehydrogenase subunit 6 [Allodia pyxidiiformis]
MLMTSLLFSQMKHPLSMGMVLLIQTLLISLSIGLMSKSFWFSYILFLVFLGGMLVMFIYVTSLSSNEMFSISNKLFSFVILMGLMSSLIFLFLDLNFIHWMNNMETELFITSKNEINFLAEENTISLLKIYNHSTNLITLFLINYLFLTLVISVKITNFFYGPLRPSFN